VLFASFSVRRFAPCLVRGKHQYLFSQLLSRNQLLNQRRFLALIHGKRIELTLSAVVLQHCNINLTPGRFSRGLGQGANFVGKGLQKTSRLWRFAGSIARICGYRELRPDQPMLSVRPDQETLLFVENAQAFCLITGHRRRGCHSTSSLAQLHHLRVNFVTPPIKKKNRTAARCGT